MSNEVVINYNSSKGYSPRILKGHFVLTKYVKNKTFNFAGNTKCREILQRDIYLSGKPMRGFAFGFKNDRDAFSSKMFMQYLERSYLGLTEVSEFHKVIVSNGLLVEPGVKIRMIIPSSFWKTEYIKFSLFTLLMRAGTRFIRSDYDLGRCLKADETCCNCLPSIIKFLSGNTQYVGKVKGSVEGYSKRFMWAERFEEKSEKEINKLLV